MQYNKIVYCHMLICARCMQYVKQSKVSPNVFGSSITLGTVNRNSFLSFSCLFPLLLTIPSLLNVLLAQV